MAELSEWLKIMLGEVARKNEDESRAAAENATRAGECARSADASAAASADEVRLGN